MILKELSIELLVKQAVKDLERDGRVGSYIQSVINWDHIGRVIEKAIQKELPNPKIKAKLERIRDNFEVRFWIDHGEPLSEK